jgi:hypothetical protein
VSQVPDLGPRILFFSGGSALRRLSEKLVDYTHNSIHLITRSIRRQFGGLAQGFRMPPWATSATGSWPWPTAA